jgi:hypothetical protein
MPPLAASRATSASPIASPQPPFPSDWKQFEDRNGQYLYADHATKQRSRMDPRLGGSAGTQFTCFTGTKLQILTPEAVQTLPAPPVVPPPLLPPPLLPQGMCAAVAVAVAVAVAIHTCVRACVRACVCVCVCM